MRLESVALTDTGLVRSMNQDSILELPDIGVYMVADGMGGEKAGEEASAQVVESCKEMIGGFFKSEPEGPSQVEGVLRDCLLRSNRDVFQISVREPDKRGLGSTASLLCLHRGVYFCSQVGDSRIYLLREGNVQQITHDHTLVWALYEQGAITRDQLETHPDRHLLTQCIGNEKPVNVDTLMGQIQAGDLFLICSDGLTGYAQESRVFEILKDDTQDLRTRAQLLIQAAFDGGGGDNVSAILVQIDDLEETDDWEPEATAPPEQFVAQDTTHAFDTSMHRPIIEPEPQPQRKRWPIALAGLVVLLAAVVSIIYATRGGDSIRVRLATDAQTPGTITVNVQRDDETPISRIAQEDEEQGLFFTVPGPGQYTMTLEAEGYMPQTLTLTIEEESEASYLKPQDWVLLPKLILVLPNQPPLSRVRVVPVSSSEAGHPEIIIESERLAVSKGQLEINILPGVTYKIVAEADGFVNYISRPQQLKAGERKTIPIYFEGTKDDGS